MAKLTKNRKAALEKFDRKEVYPIAEATKLVKETSNTKFDASVEVAFNLNIDTKKADQQIRGAMVLPAGTGKKERVLVLTSTKAKEAQEAGADFVGADDMIKKISDGWFDFDVIIATPEMMAKLGPIGRVLGPKGLMPNPKTGTVTMDVAKAIDEVKKGKVEYRADKDGNIQTIIGKVSFSAEDLAKNLKALSAEIMKQKPLTVKGEYVKSVTLSSTMGPGIKVNIEG